MSNINQEHLITKNESYTYLYLDPTKAGVFTYGNHITLFYEPFYVGYTDNNENRWEIHLNEVKRFINKNLTNKDIQKLKGNKHKWFKIKKILKQKMNPIIIKVLSNSIQQKAKEYEIQLISKIGRADKKSGPLTNMTDGGEGHNGFMWSEESRKKASVSHRGLNWYNNGIEHGKFLEGEQPNGWERGNLLKGEKNGFYGKTHSDKFCKEQSKRKKEIPLSMKHKEKISQGMIGKNTWMKGKTHSEESNAKRRSKSKNMWENRTDAEREEIGRKISKAKFKKSKEKKEKEK